MIVTPTSRPIKAIWAEAEISGPVPFSLTNRQYLQELIEISLELGFSDIFLQVARRGYGWFSSSTLDTSHLSDSNRDPLSEALDLAAQHGITVHAWINMFNLGVNPSPKAHDSFEAQDLQVDNVGNTSQFYSSRDVSHNIYAIDSEGLWLDPSSPRVRDLILATVRELIEKYPILGGIHLDFVRYPYLIPVRTSSAQNIGRDFGYSEKSISKFEESEGLTGVILRDDDGTFQPRDYKTALAWDEWRRQQVSSYLGEIKAMLSPKQILSAALLAWSDRAYLNGFQDWRSWLEEGMIDWGCLMSYTGDTKLFSHLTTQASPFRGDNIKLLSGIGLYRLLEKNQLKEQVERCLDGYALFSFGSLRGHKEFLQILR